MKENPPHTPGKSADLQTSGILGSLANARTRLASALLFAANVFGCSSDPQEIKYPPSETSQAQSRQTHCEQTTLEAMTKPIQQCTSAKNCKPQHNFGTNSVTFTLDGTTYQYECSRTTTLSKTPMLGDTTTYSITKNKNICLSQTSSVSKNSRPTCKGRTQDRKSVV